MKTIIEQPFVFSQMGQRDGQEDSFAPQQMSEQSFWFAVCDGVGGLEDGEKASQTAVQAIGEFMEHTSCDLPFAIGDAQQMLAHIYRRITDANIGEASTTLAFMCINALGITCVHVGDSRVYQFRPGTGEIFRTKDHSLMAEYIDAGMVNEEEANSSPQRNIITRSIQSLDAGNPSEATVTTLRDLQPGDVMMLCSDGVYEVFNKEDLAALLSDESKTLEQLCAELAASCENSADNNTAILVRITDVNGESDEKRPQTADTHIHAKNQPSLWDKIQSVFTTHYK